MDDIHDSTHVPNIVLANLFQRHTKTPLQV